MAPTEVQLAALERLWNVADTLRGTGGGNAAGKLLLGLYDGRRFPFDLTDLRSFDVINFSAAIKVLQMDYQPQMEVHELLNRLLGRDDMGTRFEMLAREMRLKGAATEVAIDERLSWYASSPRVGG